MKLSIVRRYRASASHKRLYGGNISVVFLVSHAGDWFYIEAFGKTTAERKAVATKKAEALLASGEFKKHTHETSCARATPPVSGGILYERTRG